MVGSLGWLDGSNEKLYAQICHKFDIVALVQNFQFLVSEAIQVVIEVALMVS